MDNLQLVTTDDLIRELNSRYANLIIGGISHRSNDREVDTRMFWQGDISKLTWLATKITHSMMNWCEDNKYEAPE